MSMQDFASKMQTERTHQTRRWGDGTEASLDATDDKQNDATDFTAYIAHHATRWFPGGFKPWSNAVLATFKTQMIKVAATAYAAHEWADREIKRREQN